MAPLESIKLFADLTPADFAYLRKATREVFYKPEEFIFKQGDAADGIYFVKEGLVRISAVVPHGDLRVLSRLGEGELFGEMAVFDNQPRSANATAEEATTVYFLGLDQVWKAFEQTPKLSAAMVREISRRLRDFNQTYMREVLESERLALVGRFASSIVHDLKNPLNIIGISADMACMPSATPESRQVSKVRIRKQVERISNMVNELLEFTQGAHTNFVLAQVNYDQFVTQLIDEIQPEAALKSVKVEYVNKPPSVPVRINPQRLSRVFHNLIGNATDAMPSGGAVRISFRQEGETLVTELQDSGKGIAPEIADRLFQAFATYGKANGTGLGLSICKKIVQDHKGQIYARNAPTGGAIFGFTLPLGIA